MIVDINGQTFNLEEARTEEEHKKGLQGVKSLEDDEGMIFIFDNPERVSFWMDGVDIPLLMVFVDEDGDVLKVKKAKPNDKTAITCDNVKYVIEVSIYADIEEDDEVEFCESETMKVLNIDGSVQMELKGNERIFSRIHTKSLIRLAKQADKSKEPDDYKRLGAALFRYMNKQDSQKQEYV